MGKLKGKQYTDNMQRLGLDLRTLHLWDGMSFDSKTRLPVAHCNEELFPRSMKYIDIKPPAKSVRCRECYGN